MSLVIVPSIDLRGGRVVRLKQGDYAHQLNYHVDPVETARSFAAEGAKWMHVVDLDGAKEGRPVQTDLISRLAKTPGLSVQAGGGIRQTEDIDRLLGAGVQRVVYTSSAATLDSAPEPGRPVPGPRHFLSEYERSKYEAERQVLELAPRLGVDLRDRKSTRLNSSHSSPSRMPSSA